MDYNEFHKRLAESCELARQIRDYYSNPTHTFQQACENAANMQKLLGKIGRVSLDDLGKLL